MPSDSPAIERYANTHLNSQSPALNDILNKARLNCREHNIPEWTATDSQGKFLKLQCRLLGVKHMLEIGTLGGQSAIWCATANKDIRITTIELKPEICAVARENVRNAGLDEQIEIIEGDGKDVLERLATEISPFQRPKFDLVSVDVETFGDSWALVDAAINVCRDGACLMVHCALRLSNPSIAIAEETVDRVRGSRELVEQVGKDKRLDAVMVMTDGEERYDTLMAVVKKT
jgi:predicted O-methyltransferase YrrM